MAQDPRADMGLVDEEHMLKVRSHGTLGEATCPGADLHGRTLLPLPLLVDGAYESRGERRRNSITQSGDPLALGEALHVNSCRVESLK